jgi:hypothetical protein
MIRFTAGFLTLNLLLALAIVPDCGPLPFVVSNERKKVRYGLGEELMWVTTVANVLLGSAG